MQGILWEESSGWLFLLVTVLMGGWAAWMAGRACAQTWRSPAVLFGYVLILAVAIRFIHFALFGGTFFVVNLAPGPGPFLTPQFWVAVHYYIVDLVVVEVIGAISYRLTRVRQMVSKYGWLFEASGPLSWQSKTSSP